MNSTYDVVVIGGGPAGIIGATTAAALGAKVALIDKSSDLGGAGANTGTAPSKTLRETALALSGAKSRELYGVDLSLRRETTVADFLRHAVRKLEAKLILKVLKANNWNRRKTAKALKISYRALLYKIREAGLPSRTQQRSPEKLELGTPNNLTVENPTEEL